MTLTATAPAITTRVRILHPGDPGWDAARGTFNTLIDQLPEAIALPTDAEQVAEAVRWARFRGLRIAGQATGHNAGAIGHLAGTLLVRSSELTEVRIDAAARRVRVGAGVRWRDVAPQLSELGLAGLHGSSPDVGVAGYSLGGGIGWLTRKHGMQTNAVTAIELVTTDGVLIRTDREHHPDLFWALRGGGGSFGIVTAIEFEVFDVPELYSGAMFFPVADTAKVLHTWNRLLPGFPDELTTWATVLHLPPFEEVPEILRGKSFVILMGAFLGSRPDGERLLAPLRELGPALDTFAAQPLSGLFDLAMDPTEPVPFRSTTALLEQLSPSVIEAIAEQANRGPTVTMVQLRHSGAAFGRRLPGSGARATLPGELVLFALGAAPFPELEAQVQAELDLLAAAVAPDKVGDYPNFVVDPTDTGRLFEPETWARLRQVKAAWDPEDIARGGHHVPPAG